MIYQLAIATALIASASAKLFSEDPVQQKAMWESFKNEHARSYESFTEETHRFHVFLENLKMADLRNEKERQHGGNAVFGITKFSDLSQAEFESQFLTSDPSLKSVGIKNVLNVERPVDTTAGLVDWTGTFTTPVKDQGYCGSCWAFSATEQIETDAIRQLKQTFLLSAEQVTQCTTAAFGCGGGWTESAYRYVQNAGGLALESDYPYTSYQGVTGQCNVNGLKKYVGVSGFTTINGESAMASYVQTSGPLSVCVDASTWNAYNGGIMSVCGQSVNHCVQAVGVDASPSGGYWKVRNSWGTGWGEDGHIRLAYGKNTCAITNDPTYVNTFLA